MDAACRQRGRHLPERGAVERRLSPQVLAVGDFNGDGRADILSSLILNINDLTGNQFTVLLGSAAATVPQINIDIVARSDGRGILFGHADGDGVRRLTATGRSPADLSPPGLILNAATGAISGILTLLVTFAYSFNVTVQDSAGNLAPEAALAISVAPAVTISMITLPGGTVGAAYSQTLTATGGASSTYTWAISSGSLPPGLTLNPSDRSDRGERPPRRRAVRSASALRPATRPGESRRQRIFQSRLRPRLRRPRSR